MGGPSAAIVIAELADLGARRLLRVGTCGALDRSLRLGELVIAREALVRDGTSRALGAGDRVASSPELLSALTAAGGDTTRSGRVVSTDLFYDDAGHEREWAAAGALAIEMETATLFALASRRGLAAGAVLIVSDLLLPERRRIDVEALRAAERHLGELAVRALSQV
jgi:uridine phosphorylase